MKPQNLPPVVYSQFRIRRFRRKETRTGFEDFHISAKFGPRASGYGVHDGGKLFVYAFAVIALRMGAEGRRAYSLLFEKARRGVAGRRDLRKFGRVDEVRRKKGRGERAFGIGAGPKLQGVVGLYRPQYFWAAVLVHGRFYCIEKSGAPCKNIIQNLKSCLNIRIQMRA